MRILSIFFRQSPLILAVFLSLIVIVEAVTLDQFYNELTPDQRDQVFDHILNGVAVNSFEDRGVQECGLDTFFNQIEGLNGLSQGDLAFFEMRDKLQEEGRLDVRIQDMIYTIIERNCVQ